MTYQYDGAGNVKAIGTERYRYDKVSRVVEGALGGGGKQSYSFDPFGNIGLITTVQGGAAFHRSYVVNPDTNHLHLTGYAAAGNQAGWGFESTTVAETIVTGRAAHRLFRRGGLVNSNRYFRVGFGRKGGERVFRIGGDLLKRTTGKSHIDLWSGGLM